MNTLKRSAAFLAVLAAAVTACGSDGQSTKAGGDGPPVTLRIGTNDPPGRPSADQIEEFAGHVAELSDGQLRIEPVWQAGGQGIDDWDQVVARQVVDGELDMGLIPARAWDTEGVMSLRALHAPFLVTSDELVAEIVSGELAGEMLGGLDSAGVTGLALLPEGLRHLFVFGDAPPASFTDFGGKVIRAPRSDTSYALFEALGATPDDPSDEAFGDGVETGAIVAAESAFAAAGTLPTSATVPGNVTLFPKVNSLVVNSDALGDLSDEQQAVLRDAAQRTVSWAVTAAPSDVDDAQVFCRNGGRIVVATDAQVEALQQAAAPVYAALEQDAGTKEMIGRIRQLSENANLTPATIAPCEPAEKGGVAPGEAIGGAFPDGVYRMEMTADFLLEAGVDPQNAVEHAGTWTLKFEDGRFEEGPCNGTYTVDGGRLAIHLGEVDCGSAGGQVLFSAGWTVEGDQLQFTDVQSGHGFDLLIENLFGGQPFTKIG